MASDHQTSPSGRLASVVAAFLVAAVTALAFIPSLRNQFLIWDDDVNFLNNPDFRGLGWANLRWMFTTFHAGHYQPVTWLTLGWDSVWGNAVFGPDPTRGPGMDPRAYHITSILLHAANTVLVYLLAVRLLGWAWFRTGTARTRAIHVTAAIAATLFAIHPLRVENVAWITERRDLVSAFLLLLAVLAYLRAVQSDASRHWRWMATAWAVYAVSLLAKVSGVPLAVTLLAMDWYPLRRIGGDAGWFGRGTRHIWLEKLPFLAIAAVFAVIATAGQSRHGWMYGQDIHPLDGRIAQSFYGMVFYFQKMFWPGGLLPLYELHLPLHPGEGRFILAMALVITGSIVAWRLRFRIPALAVALVAYAAFLGPVLGLFQNGPQIVADRYSYLPAIGLTIAVVGGAAHWCSRSGARRGMGLVATLGALGISTMLFAVTWRQCGLWRTTESLWSATLAGDPNSSVANNGMGALILDGPASAEAAIPYFQAAVRIDRASKGFRINLREALRRADRFDDLIAAWVDEARFSSQFSGKAAFDARFHAIEGTRAMDAGQSERALEHLTASLALDAGQPKVENNLAMVLNTLGRGNDAISHYSKAIVLDPKLPNPRYGLAVMLMKKGDYPEALRSIEEYLLLSPNEPSGVAVRDQLRGLTAPR